MMGRHIRGPVAVVFVLAAAAACSSHRPNDAGGDSPDAGGDEAAAPEASPDADAQALPVSVPMPVTQTSTSGSMRFSVTLQVGGAPLDVLLDTGSSGLRILQGAVPDASYASETTTAVTYSYHSGLELQGVVALATVGLGSLQTAAPIPVMLVTQIGCEAADPSCGYAGQTPQNATVFGSFKAIFGVGMRNGASQIGNPIVQLPGHPSFLVQAPAYGGTGGTLVVAPSPSQLAGMQNASLPAASGDGPLADGTPAWDDRYGLPACLDDATTGTDYCVPAELDTGNPPIYVEWPQYTGTSTTILAAGDAIQVTLGAASTPLAQYSFTVASPPTPGIDEVEIEAATGSGFMNLGTGVFFRFDAYFDQAHGVIGLRPH
jgi:Protein of unknown function (DUF3443)